jgi:hypothetical protein
MSLDVAEAPTLAAHPLTTEQRMDVFNYSHAAGVNRDFNDARNHAKGNRYVLIVTPAHIALRLTDSSSVRVDMTGAGCESYMWLRNLYRALRPDDMRVEFGDRKQLNAACGDHLEDIFMLEVRICIPGRPKKKKRTALQR